MLQMFFFNLPVGYTIHIKIGFSSRSLGVPINTLRAKLLLKTVIVLGIFMYFYVKQQRVESLSHGYKTGITAVYF